MKGEWDSRVTVHAIVNAGGSSTRMGTHKALLPMPPDGSPLLAHTVGLAAQVADTPVYVVANHAPVQAAARALPGVCLLGDDVPDQGPLAGLAVGLAQVPAWALFLACDLPFLQVDLLRTLIELAAQTDADAVVPLVDGRSQVLCALYHRRCLPAVQSLLADHTLRVRELLASVRVRHVHEVELRPADPGLRSFVNANTPAEWQAILDELRD